MLSLNKFKLTPTIFPDKTSQIWKIPRELFLEKPLVQIVWDFESEGEFLQLAQVKTLLDSMGLFSELELSYLPYGRQDKIVSNDTTFALHTFAKLINDLGFTAVWCMDPHSNVAEELIERFIPFYPVVAIENLIDSLEISTLCFPDKGAQEKYTKLFPSMSSVFGVKTRNQTTGVIENHYLNDQCNGQRVLIVDDICDGGATFVGLTKLLLETHNEVFLFVSHGIFSKGLKPLLTSGIIKIFDAKGECFHDRDGYVLRKEF